MASNCCLLILISLFILFTAVASVPEDEVQSMLTVLRSRSYSLFCNALVTSDIYYDVLNGNSFTFFVPTDISLYSLDMTVPAPQYIATLRYHVIPRRLSVFELPSVSLGHALQTMDPNVEVHVGIHPMSGTFTVEGVEIVMPGLFYGPNIAVHGLGGIINLNSNKSSPSLQQNENLVNNGSSPSPITANSPQSTSLAPPPSPISFDDAFPPPAISPVHDLLPPSYESFSRHHGSPEYGDGDSMSRSREIDSNPVASPVTDMSRTFSPSNSRIDSVPVTSPTTEMSQIESVPVVSPVTGTGTSDTFVPSNSEIHSVPVASPPVIDVSDTFSSPLNSGFAPELSPAYGLLETVGKDTPRREPQAPLSPERHNPATYFPDPDDYFHLPPLIKLLDRTKLFPMTQHEQENGDPKSTVQSPPAATMETLRSSESGNINGQSSLDVVRNMPDEYLGMIEVQQTYSDL